MNKTERKVVEQMLYEHYTGEAEDVNLIFLALCSALLLLLGYVASGISDILGQTFTMIAIVGYIISVIIPIIIGIAKAVIKLLKR